MNAYELAELTAELSRRGLDGWRAQFVHTRKVGDLIIIRDDRLRRIGHIRRAPNRADYLAHLSDSDDPGIFQPSPYYATANAALCHLLERDQFERLRNR